MSSHKIALFAILLALALGLHQVERLLPLPILPYPGVKLGLGNLVTLVSLFILSPREAGVFVVLRALLTSFITGFSGLIFSLTGALLAFGVMCSLSYLWPQYFSLAVVSIAGATAHNLGQILVASSLIGNFAIFYYLPVLMVSALLSGLAIGLTAILLLKALHRSGVIPLHQRLLPLLKGNSKL